MTNFTRIQPKPFDGMPSYTGEVLTILNNLDVLPEDQKMIAYDLESMIARGVTSKDAKIFSQRLIKAKLDRLTKSRKVLKSRVMTPEMLPQYREVYEQLKVPKYRGPK